MSTVLFLTGETMGDALGASGSGLRKVFEDQGYRFAAIRLGEPGAMDQLNATLAEGDIEFAFSHLGIGMDFHVAHADGSNPNVWRELRIPFISLNGDTPAYFFDRHVVPGSGFASLYVFPEHMEMRKRLPMVRGILGVTPPVLQDSLTRDEIDFRAKASGKLLFLKNGNDPEALVASWRDGLPTNAFLMLNELAGELASDLASDRANDIDAYVVRHFESLRLDLEATVKLRLMLVAQLDDYLRRLKSTLIVKALLDLPVEIHGYNWKHVDFHRRRAKLVEHASFADSRRLILDALGIIDMSPNTGSAPHDRPMRAFARHTLCLTNEQGFFRQTVPDLADSFLYRFDPEQLRTKVADVVANPAKAIDMGAEVASRFATGYEIERLIDQMLQVAALLRVEAMDRPAQAQRYFVWPPKRLA